MDLQEIPYVSELFRCNVHCTTFQKTIFIYYKAKTMYISFRLIFLGGELYMPSAAYLFLSLKVFCAESLVKKSK